MTRIETPILLRMNHPIDREGRRLPIKLDSTSNPDFLAAGLRTRREFLDLLGWNGGVRA